LEKIRELFSQNTYVFSSKDKRLFFNNLQSLFFFMNILSILFFQFDFFPYRFRENYKHPISLQLPKLLINNALEDE